MTNPKEAKHLTDKDIDEFYKWLSFAHKEGLFSHIEADFETVPEAMAFIERLTSQAKAYNTVKAELEWKEFDPRDEKTCPGKEGYYDVWIKQRPDLLKRFPHLPKSYPKALWWLAKEGRFFEACPGMTHYRGPMTPPPTIRGEG